MAAQAATFILQNLDSRASDILIGIKCIRDRVKAISKDSRNPYDCLRTSHVTFVHSEFRQHVQIASEYTTQPSLSSGANWGGDAVFELKQVGHFWSDMVLNIGIDAIGSQTAPALGSTLYNYCDLPGIRLVEDARFTVDNYVIDSYGTDEALIHRSLYVPLHKRTAWDKAHGQEQPRVGYLYHRDSNVREQRVIMSGAQTPRPYQPALDLWIPTLFWFNHGIENALSIGSVPTATVPWGQRTISFKIATADKIIQQRTTLTNGVLGDPRPVSVPPAITKCMLYINHLFMDPDVFDLYMRQATFSLARLHLRRNAQINTSDFTLPLKELKYPTENLVIGLRPIANSTDLENWHRFSVINRRNLPVPAHAIAEIGVIPRLIRENLWYTELADVITGLALTAAGGIKLFELNTTTFYDSYLPLRKSLIVSPSEPGLFYMPFNQYPLEKQPSGFIDLSKIINLELSIKSGYITPMTPVNVVVAARTINFLMIGKKVGLRFAL